LVQTLKDWAIPWLVSSDVEKIRETTFTLITQLVGQTDNSHAFSIFATLTKLLPSVRNLVRGDKRVQKGNIFSDSSKILSLFIFSSFLPMFEDVESVNGQLVYYFKALSFTCCSDTCKKLVTHFSEPSFSILPRGGFTLLATC